MPVPCSLYGFCEPAEDLVRTLAAIGALFEQSYERFGHTRVETRLFKNYLVLYLIF
jgi:hypothetical protein